MMGWGSGCELGGAGGVGRMGGWGMMGGPFLGLLILLVVIALVVVLAVSLARRRRPAAAAAASGGLSGALDVAQRRLASGEINTDEYRQIREALES